MDEPRRPFGKHLSGLLYDLLGNIHFRWEPAYLPDPSNPPVLWRGLVRLAITALILFTCLPVVLNPKASADSAKLAAGFIGTVLGWWAA